VSDDSPPSAGPYYVSKSFNGEFLIMKRNPNYAGPHPARLDAIAFRMGMTSERAVARVRSGNWDGVILPHEMLAPSGAMAIATGSDPKLRTEELPLRGIAF
jgi:ABC-type oligopeptide transport system substrate-binding subunit